MTNNRMPEVGKRYRSISCNVEIIVKEPASFKIEYGTNKQLEEIKSDEFFDYFEPLEIEESNLQNQPQVQVSEEDTYKLKKLRELKGNEFADEVEKHLHNAKVEEAKENLKIKCDEKIIDGFSIRNAAQALLDALDESIKQEKSVSCLSEQATKEKEKTELKLPWKDIELLPEGARTGSAVFNINCEIILGHYIKDKCFYNLGGELENYRLKDLNKYINLADLINLLEQMAERINKLEGK